MIHQHINETASHWGVSLSATKPGDVLVQLSDDEGESIRLSLSPKQAIQLAEQLLQAASKAPK